MLDRPLTLTYIFLTASCLFSLNTFAKSTSIQQQLNKLSTSFNGHIGLSAINTANGQYIHYHADEPTPIQSTFKFMLVSAILKNSMAVPDFLGEKISIPENDLVSWSPETTKYVGRTMTVGELCRATMIYSDNTAANLLMKKLGGPKTVTAFARNIGDNNFRIDHWETHLNSDPQEKTDSSTPKSMQESLQKIVFAKVLGPSQRQLLISWMKANTTGDKKIRAGVPKTWTVADKTGAGSYGIANDIAILWPKQCAPLIMTVYTYTDNETAPRQETIIAKVARIVSKEFSKKDHCIKKTLVS